jgi:phage shock protein B
MLWTYAFVIILVAMILSYQLRRHQLRDSERFNEEDTQSIQAIHKGLLKMEERIEALETILLDKHQPSRERERVE